MGGFVTRGCFNMKNSAKFIIFLLFIIFCALCFQQVFAGSLTWTCPVCGQTFDFDPRDTGYRNDFAQRHLSMHNSAQSTSNSSAGYGMTGDPVFDAFFPFINQMFQSVGEEIGKSMFSPSTAQQQVINTEMENLKAQQAAAALEQQRLREEQHQKLLAVMKKLPGSGDLGLKKPPGAAANLALKTLEDTPDGLKIKDVASVTVTESSNVLDNLKHAAFFMNKAAATDSTQEADFYADQAFIAADGGELYFDVPPVGAASAVTEKDADTYMKMKLQMDNTRKEYMIISDRLAVKHQQNDVLKKAANIAEEKVKQQEEKVKSLPKEITPQEKAAEESKLAQARKLLEEAKGYEAKADKDLKDLQKESERMSSTISQKKDEQQKFLSGLGSRK